MSLLDKASLIVTPNAYKASKLYSVVPSSGEGDIDVVRATTATRVNSLGFIESVANNVPRIDYTNGSCPSLLVEPQRTNLFVYSNRFNTGVWLNARMSIINDTIMSPEGLQNGNSFVEDSSLNSHPLYTFPISVTIGQTYTISIFVKKGSRDSFIISRTGGNAVFNLANGTTSSSGATIKLFSNGFYRCTLTFTAISLTSEFYFEPAINGDAFYQGNGSTSLYVYGGQMEQGSYPTSYIPTVASTVTRNADVISKTGISSLIGTEFTLFLDAFETTGGNNTRYLILKGAGGLYTNILILESNSSNQIVLSLGDSAAIFGSISGSLTNGQRFKLGVRCKNNDFAFYVNGALLGSQTSGTVPTFSDLYLGYYTDYNDNYNKINSSIIFNTALTNTELTQLTTL